MNKKDRKVVLKEMEGIMQEVVTANKWGTLCSQEYSELLTVTEIGKKIIIDGKTITGKRVNELLEEMGFIQREGKKVILTNKGKKFGKYAICIKINSQKPLITDIGYVKYKSSVVEEIKIHLQSKSNSREIYITYGEPVEIEKPRVITVITSTNKEEEQNV